MTETLKKLKELHEFYRSGEYSIMGISIALGVNRKTVCRWLQGENPPSKRHKKQIQSLVQRLAVDKNI